MPEITITKQPWAKSPEPEVAPVAEPATQTTPEVTPPVVDQAAPVAEAAPAAEVKPAPEEVVKAEGVVVDMVTVTVPKAYRLRIDHFQEFAFKAGIQQMERAHAEHWYSKANGVVIYVPVTPA